MRLDHIAIAVHDIHTAAHTFTAGLGLTIEHTETVAEQGARVAFIPMGDSDLELLEPIGDESPIFRFLERRGEGMHHICFEVDDIAAAMERLRAEGAELINSEPVPGAGNSLVAFIHPRSAHGVLLELVQKSS